MEIPDRPRASIRLDRSRPVLMTHLAPRACWLAMRSSSSRGMGGFSNSAKSVPSKSVEMSFIVGIMMASQLAARHDPGLRFLCQNVMSALQEQYDEAMFAFSTGDYDAAIARLKTVLASEPSYFDARLA